MKLDGTIAIAAPATDAWALIINPISLSACMPGVQDIRQIDERTFEGTISASVGPIDGNFAFRSVMTRAVFPDDLASWSREPTPSRRVGWPWTSRSPLPRTVPPRRP